MIIRQSILTLVFFAAFSWLHGQEIVINDEELTLDNITIYVDGSVQENSAASIRGIGEIVSNPGVTLNGNISPGFSVGQININGDLNFGNSGTYSVEVEGNAGEGLAGGNDALFVDGDVAADGTLDIIVPNGFVPVLTDEFVLVNYTGSVGGTFDNVVLPAEFSAPGWEIYYGDLVSNAIVLANILVLPVEITVFNAERENQSALLTWQTSIETNNLGFDVQHSTNGLDWSSIGWVDGQGNSSQPTNYQLLHHNPEIGRNFYLLKQYDFNDVETVSDVRFVDFQSNNKAIIYPNPASDYVKISVQNEQPLLVRVYDSKGVLRLERAYSQEAISLKGLESGAYYCALSYSRGKDLVLPFVVQ